MNKITAEQIHSCSYYCGRPACIKAQRDELRDKLAEREQPPAVVTDEMVRIAKRAAWEVAGEGRPWLSDALIRAALEAIAPLIQSPAASLLTTIDGSPIAVHGTQASIDTLKAHLQSPAVDQVRDARAQHAAMVAKLRELVAELRKGENQAKAKYPDSRVVDAVKLCADGIYAVLSTDQADPLTALAAQAQEFDMGYGKPADPAKEYKP